MRFPGFQEELYSSYKKHFFKDIFHFSTGKNIKQNEASPEFEIPCVRYGELYYMYNEVIKEVINRTNLDKSELLLSIGDEILLPSAGEDSMDIGSASALTIENVAIGRTINILKPIKANIYSQIYVSYYINQKLRKKISTLAKGSSISNVYNSDLKTLEIVLPNLGEQTKTASFLSLIDERITTQRKTIRELKVLKIQIRNKLFAKIIKDNFETVLIEDILNYEQPTKYIVSSTEYSSDNSLIPVLTANKAFVLGYTDESFGIYNKGKCIILDDFTMDLKYVDFSFKVKSSAIKILTAKKGVNLKFIFEYFSFLNFSTGEHKRHYISEIQPITITLPLLKIQNETANFLFLIDSKISLESDLLVQYENQKKYLLTNLFI